MSERIGRQAEEDVERRRREQTGQIGAEDKQVAEEVEEIEQAATKEGTDQDTSPGR